MLYLTLRNVAQTEQQTTVALDRAAIGISGTCKVESVLLGASEQDLDVSTASFGVDLPTGEIEMLRLSP